MPTCPLCGLVTDDLEPLERCRATYDELCGYSLARGRSEFIHQHVVDAYAAQHQTPESKPIQAVFALIGLFLMAERGFNGVEVQNAHMELARRKPAEGWPRLGEPPRSFPLTVADAMAVQAGQARDQKIREWARLTWEAWTDEQARIREIARMRLGIS